MIFRRTNSNNHGFCPVAMATTMMRTTMPNGVERKGSGMKQNGGASNIGNIANLRPLIAFSTSATESLCLAAPFLNTVRSAARGTGVVPGEYDVFGFIDKVPIIG
jgi:hypothetical protein